MAKKSGRHLTPEDLDLWRRFTRDIKPFRPEPERWESEAPDLSDRSAPQPVIARMTDVPTPRPANPPPLKVGAIADIDRRTAQKFTRGKMAIGGRIDLHGLTVDQAHRAVTGYLKQAHGRGERCIVVVTGKGRGDGSEGVGRIRRELPRWLEEPSLRALILAVTEAQPHHGGGGAFYVLLRRRRV